MLVPHAEGNYRFLPGIAPYSSGVVAAPGYEVVHATLRVPVPYRAGFDLIARHLASLGRPRAALCAIELRSPAPFSFAGFAEFNQGYRQILSDWSLLVDGENPVARTNVAPVVRPPSEASLYGFAYTLPGAPPAPPTFVVAGSGELRPGSTTPAGIVRPGETSAEALREKASYVMSVMQARLAGLGAGWSDVSAVEVYTAHPIEPFLADEILAQTGPAAVHGVRWFLSRPPIAGLEYEMDLRGVRQEIRLD